MSSGLPAFVDPIRLAREGARLKGVLTQEALPRLREAGQDENLRVAVDLQFLEDTSGLRRLRGQIRATLTLVCQRCLQPMRQELVIAPRAVFLRLGEGEDRLGPEDEAVPADETLPLAGLVEDEILLALPIMPVHASDQCPATARQTVGEPVKEVKRPNPFAVLAKLKESDK